MNDNYQDRGPAFPAENIATVEADGNATKTVYNETGMSLRDYFASAALQGLCSGVSLHCAYENLSSLTGSAYNLADAMLKARAKK